MSFRQPWTQNEDEILDSLIKKHGTQNWVLISEKMEAKTTANPRSGKQCRQRWYNHLDPSICKNSWTLQQQKTMFDAHKQYGNRWSEIASKLNNRSDSDVKNHFYAVIRKCLRRMSKMFGQKNSTQKIKNIKPTVLSRLLEDKSDNMAKQSSEALFKFIFDKQSLTIASLTALEKLTVRIIAQSSESHDQKSQEIEQKPQKEEKKAKIRQLPNRNDKKSQSENSIIQMTLQKKQRNPQKSKKIEKSKAQKKNSKTIQQQLVEKQNNSEEVKKGIDEQFQSLLNKRSSFRLSAIDNSSPGFRWIEQLPDSLIGKRKCSGDDMRRIMSNNDQSSIYVTPLNPTPGYGQSLFQSWSLPMKLTKEEIDDQRQKIRKQISRNNQQIQN